MGITAAKKYKEESIMSFHETDRAQILAEALPYIQQFSGETIVVKYDSAAVPQEMVDDVLSDITMLSLVGMRVVLVHGGRPEINAMLARLGMESRFEDGLRCTDKDTMSIVQQVLCGQVNKDLVTRLNWLGGGYAMGLSGLDGIIFEARQLDKKYGLVGSISRVHATIVEAVLDKGCIPVVASIASAVNGPGACNVDADTAASKLAVALGAKKLIVLSGVRGLLQTPDDESSLIHELQLSSVPPLVREGVIAGEMARTVDCCVHAVRSGVGSAVILDGRMPHALLTELLTDAGVGTMLTH